MKKLIRFIRNYFSSNKLDLSAKRVVGNTTELVDITMSTFNNLELINSIKRDIIILIISNNFIADPVHILSFFRRNYDFTINEFVILCYRIGMVTRNYLDNPVHLLSEALMLKDVFSQRDIEELQHMLEHQKAQDRRNFEMRVNNFNAMQKENVDAQQESESTSAKDENTIANELIDKWLNRNKNKE